MVRKAKGIPRERWVRKSILAIDDLADWTCERVAMVIKYYDGMLQSRLIWGWVEDDPRPNSVVTISHVLVGLDVECGHLMATIETAGSPTGHWLSYYIGKYGDEELVLEGTFLQSGDIDCCRLDIGRKGKPLYPRMVANYRRLRRRMAKKLDSKLQVTGSISEKEE